MKKYLLLLFLLSSEALLVAQDAQFTQFDRSPLYLNPAFAGTAPQYRLGLVHRNQWLGLDANFQTTYLAFDYNAAHLRSGFGVLGSFDQVGTAMQRQSYLAGLYSFYVPVGKWQLRLGLQAAWGNRFLDAQSLVFTSQVLDHEPDVFEGGANASRNYFDVSSGFLFFNKNFWAGASFHHINRPDYSLFSNTSASLPLKMSVHFGANWQIHTLTGDIFVLPSFLYKQQGAAQQMEMGLRMAFEGFPLVAGLSYRGMPFEQRFGFFMQDALNFVVIFEGKKFSLGYSYDLTVSGLAPYSGGSHEISLEWLWAKRKAHLRDILCPTFMKNKTKRP